MKKMLFFLGFLLFANFLVAQQFHNLSFETASDSLPKQPAKWSSSKGLSILRTEIISPDQDFAVNVKGNMADDEYGFFDQKVEIELDGLKHLNISAKLRVDELNDSKIVIYACAKKGKTFLSFKTSDPLTVEAANEWVQRSVQLWVSPLATEVLIGVRLSGQGNIFIDNFEVEEITIPNKPMNKTAQSYVDEILEIINENSLYKDELDLSALQEMIQLMSGGAQSIAEVQEVMPFVIKHVDKHSMFWSKEVMERWRAPKENAGEEEKEAVKKTPAIEVTTGRNIDDDIAYLSMPGVGSGNVDELVYFADTLQQLIKSLDRPNLKGWVVDLRNNTGGNCWPMLAGIGPVLGEGVCGFFALEEDYTPWAYSEGASLMGDMNQTKISQAPYQLAKENPKVAVLMGSETASSGEVTAVAFIGRPNTKTFGQRTAGYSTTNSNFELSDGAMLLLAVSVYADRDKNKYGKEIAPEVLIEPVKGEDKTLEKALEWLRR